MSTKKRTPKPAPPVETFAIDKSETLAKAEHEAADSLVAALNALPDLGGKTMTIEQHEPIHFEFALCPICGSRQTTEICPVDGHRFEET